MKKHSLIVLILCFVLLTIGTVLVMISYVTANADVISHTITISGDFQMIDIDLSEAVLEVKLSDHTYVETVGYRKNAISVYQKDGKLMISNTIDLARPIVLSGLGQSILDSKATGDNPKIVLYVSPDDLSRPVNIALQDSSLFLDASFSYLTLYAEKSRIICTDLSFVRFDAHLFDCDTELAVGYDGYAFSREIETHNTKLLINGDERANADYYYSSEAFPFFRIISTNGKFVLVYPSKQIE